MPETPSDVAHQAAQLQRALVDSLKKQRVIRSTPVEAAFRAVPRHLFLPATPLEQVYADDVVVTKTYGAVPISSSSQPSMMAIMLEQAAFKPGQHVLEIGAGTGYNSALIAHLVGQNGHVTSVDIDEDIVTAAESAIREAGYGDRVQVIQSDGWQGFPPNAPYDRVLLSVGAHDISPPWFAQLIADGRLILPLDVWMGVQYAVAFVKHVDHLVGLSAHPCGFMPLRGESAGYTGESTAAADENLHVTQLIHHHPPLLTLDALRELINTPFIERSTGLDAQSFALQNSGFGLWLSSQSDDYIIIHARRPSPIPALFDGRGGVHTVGLAHPNGLALLMADPRQTLDQPKLRLWIRYWGDDTPARRLLGALRAWSKDGQPDARRLHIAAYPAAGTASIPPKRVRLDKRFFTYALHWE